MVAMAWATIAGWYGRWGSARWSRSHPLGGLGQRTQPRERVRRMAVVCAMAGSGR